MPASRQDKDPTLTRRILPLLTAAWFIAYIDRFNVGFAVLQMRDALRIPLSAFGFGAGIFFVGYALFEIPSNIILSRVGARRWLSRILISWGVITVAMVATAGPRSFYMLRLLLGVAEAGCFPGMAFYLSEWCSVKDNADALAKLGSMSQISAIVGGPLAAALFALDGVGHLAGWQWLFVVEGIPAIVIGVCVLRFLPDPPRDREHIEGAAKNMKEELLHGRTALLQVIRNKTYWKWALVFASFNSSGSVIRLWQPYMVSTMSSLTPGAVAMLTAIPGLAGTAAILLGGWSSSRLDERRFHSGVPMIVGGVALSLVGAISGVAATIAALSVSTMAVACQPPIFAEVSVASDRQTRAVAIAFVNSVAMLGGFLGPYVAGYLLEGVGAVGRVSVVFGALLATGGLLAMVPADVRTRHARVLPA